MMTDYFESRFRILQLRGGQDGPLLDVFAEELRQSGFAKITARRHVRAAEHLLYWAKRKGKAWEAFHAGSRQGLRQPGCGDDVAGHERHAARCAKQQAPTQCHRPADHATLRLHAEPIAAAHHRADVCVAESGGGDEESQTAWPGKSELVISVRGSRLQSVANPATKAGGTIVRSAGGAGFQVPRRFRNQQSIKKMLRIDGCPRENSQPEGLHAGYFNKFLEVGDNSAMRSFI